VIRFYRVSHVLLAPNDELVAWLTRLTGKPTWLMRRGVDTRLFSPEKRDVADDVFRIGYVGRLSPEKNVRILPQIERALQAATDRPFHFVVVGEGLEREWLAREMSTVELPGVLRGETLARTYANMDLFVFPSETDTFGIAVLEALASGTPAVVTAHGGPKDIVEDGTSGVVARDADGFVEAILGFMNDHERHRFARTAARARACKASWDDVFTEVYDVYSHAVTVAPPADTGSGRSVHSPQIFR
jgi:phosphatidylinositol alpha 1,6-mannosyltransferase